MDIVIIDEASQAKEIEAWFVTSLAPKLILVGDTFQLPPTVLSNKAKSLGLDLSLMERLIKDGNTNITMYLRTQHRTNEQIMKWISNNVYDGTITTDASCKNSCLSDLKHVQHNQTTLNPLIVIDTGSAAQEEKNYNSISNPKEARIVEKQVESLLKSGVKGHEISIITPYKGQAQVISRITNIKSKEISVKTIDAFQGSENEAIIVSMVRSNPKKKIGFLRDNRRMNVAFTRTKRQLTVIGDWKTLSSNPLLKSFIEYATQNNKVEKWVDKDDTNQKQAAV